MAAGAWLAAALPAAAQQPVAPPPPPPAEGSYELWAVEEQPRLRNADKVAERIAAAYPPALADSGIGGQVRLRLRILENGRVDPESVSVLQATNPAFVEAATTVARQMRFAPAKARGRPMKVWVELPIHFRSPVPRPAEGDSARTGARP